MHKSCCSGLVYDHYMVKHEFRLIVLHSGNNIVYLFSNLPFNSTKLLLKAKSLILFHFIKVVTFCMLSPSGFNFIFGQDYILPGKNLPCPWFRFLSIKHCSVFTQFSWNQLDVVFFFHTWGIRFLSLEIASRSTVVTGEEHIKLYYQFHLCNDGCLADVIA